MSRAWYEPEREGFFFRDRKANTMFVSAFLLTIPWLCVEISARNLWPRWPFGYT